MTKQSILEKKNVDCHEAKASRNDGFTLAEVLITLVIIGVIAAITVPTLIARYQEEQTVSKLRKSYSTVANAFNKAIAMNGPVNTWNINTESVQEASTDVYNILKPNLNIIKDCGLSAEGDCFAPAYTRLNGVGPSLHNATNDYYKAVLADGSAFSVRYRYPLCDFERGSNSQLKHVCGIIHIDINGHKKPNVNGKDMFEFWLTKYGIYPRGSLFESDESNSKLENKGGCMDTTTQGFGCSSWVLINGNMDYLHHTVHWDANYQPPVQEEPEEQSGD